MAPKTDRIKTNPSNEQYFQKIVNGIQSAMSSSDIPQAKQLFIWPALVKFYCVKEDSRTRDP